MSPRFSIIVPVYKVEAYLRQCLDSVMAQSFTDWECICVDDGSPDGCPAILDEYARRDSRIVVKHQWNAGVSVARNNGLDAARGEWIIFVDSDDYVANDLLARISSKINAYPDVDCVAFGATWLNEDGNPKDPVVESGERLFASGDGVLGCFRSSAYGRFVHCIWDKAYRRSILEKCNLRFPTGIMLAEDSHFTQMYLLNCGKVFATLERYGYFYRQRETSAVKNVSVEMLAGELDLFALKLAAWKKFPKNGYTRIVALYASALPSLGRGTQYRSACVGILLKSDVFKSAMAFISRHGSVKGIAFACAYLLSPMFLKAILLKKLD